MKAMTSFNIVRTLILTKLCLECSEVQLHQGLRSLLGILVTRLSFLVLVNRCILWFGLFNHESLIYSGIGPHVIIILSETTIFPRVVGFRSAEYGSKHQRMVLYLNLVVRIDAFVPERTVSSLILLWTHLRSVDDEFILNWLSSSVRKRVVFEARALFLMADLAGLGLVPLDDVFMFLLFLTK